MHSHHTHFMNTFACSMCGDVFVCCSGWGGRWVKQSVRKCGGFRSCCGHRAAVRYVVLGNGRLKGKTTHDREVDKRVFMCFYPRLVLYIKRECGTVTECVVDGVLLTRANRDRSAKYTCTHSQNTKSVTRDACIYNTIYNNQLSSSPRSIYL